MMLISDFFYLVFGMTSGRLTVLLAALFQKLSKIHSRELAFKSVTGRVHR